MSPATIKRIVLEIRHRRELIADEGRRADLHKSLHAELIRDSFEYVGFWRSLMIEAERRLGVDE